MTVFVGHDGCIDADDEGIDTDEDIGAGIAEISFQSQACSTTSASIRPSRSRFRILLQMLVLVIELGSEI